MFVNLPVFLGVVVHEFGDVRWAGRRCCDAAAMSICSSPPASPLGHLPHNLDSFIFYLSHQPTGHRMDVTKAIQTYLFKMINQVPGMKVLLLDSHTVRRLSPDARPMEADVVI